jgi:hypothetical protein
LPGQKTTPFLPPPPPLSRPGTFVPRGMAARRPFQRKTDKYVS